MATRRNTEPAGVMTADRYVIVVDPQGLEHRVLFAKDGIIYGYENLTRDKTMLKFLLNSIAANPILGIWPEKGFEWREKVTVEGIVQ